MPRLSLVIPAHNVERYIEQCLTTVTSSSADLEVLVMDDGSTDSTRLLIQQAMERDGRIGLMPRSVPQGPGPARNAGLEAATGDFVWFVDGDDWLLDGAIERVLGRLDEDLDLLLIGHVSVDERGGQHPGYSSEMLNEAPRGPFTVEDWPDAVTLAHVPWNRVTRRDYLRERHILFADAPVYEDVVLGFRSLLEARTIGIESAACYAYRTGRPGALTITRGSQHLCWAAQWDTVLNSARPRSQLVRDTLFRHMVMNGWYVLWHDNRLGAAGRRPFFDSLVGLHDRYRRDGGPQDPILATGSWPVARILHPAIRARDRLRRVRRR